MVRLLILVQVLDIVRGYIACPLDVEKVRLVRLYHCKTSRFTGVDHCVIDVGRVTDPERHVQVFDLLPRIHSDPICDTLQPNVGGVLEESHGWASLKDRLKEGDLVGMRLKNAVGQTALVFLEKPLVERVLAQKALYFSQREVDWVRARCALLRLPVERLQLLQGQTRGICKVL